MPASKIARVKDGSGDVHFKIEVDTGADADVVLTEVATETVDPSDFGMTAVPSEATVYDVATIDPSHSSQALWNKSEKRLVLTTEQGTKNYAGSLERCILQAYRDGILA
ncbi:MAG: hypothetical protein WB799_24245 [Candidatus Sulfotelmatobacter sp.]